MSRRVLRISIRVVVWCLLVLYLAVYLAAKIHFLGWYSRIGSGAYLRQHVWFWVGLLGLGLLVWLLEKVFPENIDSRKS
jgi:hypothetical protein